MSKTTNWLLAGAALTLLLGAGAAVAHEPAAKKDGDRAERQAQRDVRVHRSGPGHGGHHVVVRGDRDDHLRDILQLRPDQEPALKAFLEATKRDQPRHEMVRFEHDDDKTTTERLAQMEARLAEQQATMKARIDATRTFYAQLDAKQRKAFDAMPMLMMVGPGLGPMMLPHRIAHRMPLPPQPPAPPTPPAPPAPRL